MFYCVGELLFIKASACQRRKNVAEANVRRAEDQERSDTVVFLEKPIPQPAHHAETSIDLTDTNRNIITLSDSDKASGTPLPPGVKRRF